jgi:hypothetical protein
MEDTMAALIQQLALVSESKAVPLADVMKVAAALQKQASRDLAPIWSISATVDAFEALEDVPMGYWPMIVRDDIEVDAAGIHSDKDNQPFALIAASEDIDEWALTASHETLEMLVDPFGNRVVAGDSPKPGQKRVEFLVEVSDPSESAEFGYSVNGILVSDFYTPRFFDPFAASGVRYSFTGAVLKPRQIRRGGYLSWHDPVSDHWWQQTWFSGSKPKFADLGKLTAQGGSIRAQIDRFTAAQTAKAMAGGRKAAKVAGMRAKPVHDSTASRASHLRSQISALIRSSVPSRRSAAGRGRARRK